MNEFVLFGTTHLLTLAIIFIASFGFAYFAKSNYSEQAYLPFEKFFGCLLIANELLKPLDSTNPAGAGIRTLWKHIGLDEKGPFKTMWKAIKGIFGPEGKIAQAMKVLTTAPIEWFDEQKELQRLFRFLKRVFGAEGKIAKGLAAIADAEDFVGFGSDMQKMMRWLKGFFGADGKLANGWKRIKNLIPDFTGEKGIMTKVFNGIKGLFGPDSAGGRLGAKLSEWGE